MCLALIMGIVGAAIGLAVGGLDYRRTQRRRVISQGLLGGTVGAVGATLVMLLITELVIDPLLDAMSSLFVPFIAFMVLMLTVPPLAAVLGSSLLIRLTPTERNPRRDLVEESYERVDPRQD